MVENKCIEFIDEMIVRRKTCIFYWFLWLNFSCKQHLQLKSL
jgi:hypothetical protein